MRRAYVTYRLYKLPIFTALAAVRFQKKYLEDRGFEAALSGACINLSVNLKVTNFTSCS